MCDADVIHFLKRFKRILDILLVLMNLSDTWSVLLILTAVDLYMKFVFYFLFSGFPEQMNVTLHSSTVVSCYKI